MSTVKRTQESEYLQGKDHPNRAQPRSGVRRLWRRAPWFLPLKEVSSEYFIRPVDSGKTNIKAVLKEGQDIVVQIDKEERGNKGAALTTFVSLAGRFIVLKPNKPRSGGVSRRIVGDDRDVARDSLNEVEIPDNMSVILRTAGIDRTAEELAWDLEEPVEDLAGDTRHGMVTRSSPFLIYRESNAVFARLRDYLGNDVGEILVDDEATFQRSDGIRRAGDAAKLRKLKHYTDAVPLFTRGTRSNRRSSRRLPTGESAFRRQHRHRPHGGTGFH